MTIMLAITGAYLVAHIAGFMRGRIDTNMLRAKAFLNKSFMRDNWMLLFLVCIFFLVNATVKFDEMFGLIIENSSTKLIQDASILGVMACSTTAEYKWFKLLKPVNYEQLTTNQDVPVTDNLNSVPVDEYEGEF